MAHKDVGEYAGDVSGPHVFREEGEYWTVAFTGPVFRLRDAKGMRYLAWLLARPGQRVPAAELLDAMMHGAKDGNPSPNARPATGKQGPSVERARLAVTQCIKAALKKIQVHDASLGHHLSTCIRTGHLCAYVPDPARPLRWEL
jgi:hypothetical protein